jgi:hypothetical protein
MACLFELLTVSGHLEPHEGGRLSCVIWPRRGGEQIAASSLGDMRDQIAKARSVAVLALLVMASSLFADSSRAEDECLVAPNAKAPQGGSWHFHWDPLKQRKCWYVRTDDQAIQKKPVGPAVGEAPITTQAPRPKSDVQSFHPGEETPVANDGNLTQWSTQDSGQAEAPAPSSPSPGQLSDAVERNGTEGNISTDSDIGRDEIPIAVLLAFGSGLVFVGICLYQIVSNEIWTTYGLNDEGPPGDRESAQGAALPRSEPVTPSAATASPEVVRLLEPMAGDLADVRRSLEQLAAKQEQMAKNIARLQAVEEDIREPASPVAPGSLPQPTPPTPQPLIPTSASAQRVPSDPS